jgi:hypothetical protein
MVSRRHFARVRISHVVALTKQVHVTGVGSIFRSRVKLNAAQFVFTERLFLRALRHVDDNARRVSLTETERGNRSRRGSRLLPQQISLLENIVVIVVIVVVRTVSF